MTLAAELQELSRVIQTIINVTVLASCALFVTWIVLLVGGRWLK